MLLLEEFKICLGDLANELTEEQILKLWEQQDKEAEIYFDMWLEEINKKSVSK